MKQPQSAYELQKNVEYRHISRWVKISTPSIYKKVVQLEKKGYLKGKVIKEGKMPEKAIYYITESGECHFLELMEQKADEMVQILFDFNAVIMNLDLVSDDKKEELLEAVNSNITDIKHKLEERIPRRAHIPAEGKAIMKQQLMIANVLDKWITELREEYPEGKH